nr:MAG TPA: hypothetical protein [Caudoviricetes sp.]
MLIRIASKVHCTFLPPYFSICSSQFCYNKSRKEVI